jgi:type I restriction enzyme S subunit
VNWPTATLGEITQKIGSGSTPRGGAESYKSRGIPFIRSMNVYDGQFLDDGLAYLDEPQATALKHVTLHVGDVLLNITGASVARVCRLPDQLSGGRVNQHVSIIRPDKERLDSNFLAHLLRAPEAKLRLLRVAGAGATREAITKAQIEQFRIPLPPPVEQRRIAAILDQADALRGKRKHSLDLLDSLTQSIFLEMFGNPESNPKRWKRGRIFDLLEGTQYGTSEKAGENGKYPILRMGNLTTDGRMDFESLKYIDLDDKDLDRYTVRRGDILFNRTNSADLVGKTAVFDRDERFAFAGYLVRARVKSGVSPHYVASYLNSRHGKATLRGMAKSIVGMANINAKEMQSIPILIPDVQTQHAYSDALASIEASRIVSRRHMQLIDSSFSCLQSRAFSGQL